MASNDFVIRIVVDARNRAAGAIQAAVGNILGLERAANRASRGVGRLDNRIGALETNIGKATAKLRSINPTLDSLDRKLRRTSASISSVNRGFNTMDRRIDRVNTAFGSAVALIARLERRLNQLDRKMAAMGARSYRTSIDVDTRRSETKVNALIGKLASATRGVYTARTDVETRAAMAKAEALRRELERIGEGDLATNLILQIDNEQEILAKKRLLGRDINVKVEPEVDNSAFARTIVALEVIQQYSQRTGESFRIGYVALINAAIQLAIVFSGPLLSGVVGVAGGLVAVGGAAVQAGAGLAGLATAIMGQTLPVIGLLILALTRVAAVMRVFDLGNRVSDAAQRNAARSDDARTAALNRLSRAHENVARAQDVLVRAQDNLRLSQERLNEARRDGIRTLQDLVLAERRATLGAEESELDLAISAATGSFTGSFESAQLENAAKQLDARRQRADTRRALAGGVDRLPAVMQASRAVEDARRAVEDARIGLRDANRQVGESLVGLTRANEEISSIEEQYQSALNELSGAETRLLRSVERFAALFTDRDSPYRRISDIMIGSFAYGLDQITELLGDNDVIRAFENLASAIGASVRELADFLTSPYMRNALVFFTDESARNASQVTNIFTGILRLITAIGRAASPALAIALGAVSQFFTDLSASASSASGQNSLSRFFLDSLDPIRAFLRLGGSVLELMFALIGPGGAAEEGTRGIDALTGSINRATEYVKINGREIQRFFADAIFVTGHILRLILDIGAALIRAFEPDLIAQFTDFLGSTVLPALEKFIRFTTIIAEALMTIASTPVGSDIVQVLSFLFAARFTISLVARLVSGLARSILFLGRAIRLLPRAAGLAGVLGLLGRGGRGGGAGFGFGRVFDERSARTSGGRFGRLFGGGFVSSAGSLIRTAGWFGVGISAVNGIMSAFRYDSVRAGIQDFASSISFGLIDSFEESTKKRMREALQEINEDIRNNVRNALDYGTELAPPRMPSAGARGPATQIDRRQDTSYKRFTDELKKLEPELGAIFERIDTRYRRYVRNIQGRSPFERTAERTRRDLDVIRRIIEAYRTAIATLPRDSAIRVAFERELRAAQAVERELDASFRRIQEKANNQRSAFRAAFDFSVDLQLGRDIERDVDRFVDKLRTLPQRYRGFAVNQALQQAAMLRNQGRITQDEFESLSARILRAQDTLTRRHKRRNDRLREQGAATSVAVVNSAVIAINGVVAVANNALRTLGFSGIRLPTNMREARSAAGAIGRGIGFISNLLGNAQGGIIPRATSMIGQIGERGKDTVVRALGRGEVVLNHWQQRAVNARLRGQDTLYSIVNRTRGYHAGGPEQPGYSGGYAGRTPSGNIAVPVPSQYTTGTPEFIAAQVLDEAVAILRRYGAIISDAFATSGHVGAGHLQYGTAIDVIPGPTGWEGVDRAVAYAVSKGMTVLYDGQFGSTAYPNHGRYHHAHIELVDGALGRTGRVIEQFARTAARSVDMIRRVRIRGRGIANVAEGAINRVISAANRRIRRAARTARPEGQENVTAADGIVTLPPGGGVTVGASQFGGPTDPSTGTTGYRGDNLAQKPDSYAELSNNPEMGVNADFAALGGLPYMTKLRITGPSGRSAFAYKRDVGAGGGPVNGHKRAIDLWYTLASAIGVNGLDLVRIRRMAQGGIARVAEWGGWHARGLDRIFTRPTLLGVGEDGPERVIAIPARSSSSATGYDPSRDTIQPEGGQNENPGRRVIRRLKRVVDRFARDTAEAAARAAREAAEEASSNLKTAIIEGLRTVNPFRAFRDTLRVAQMFARGTADIARSNLDNAVRLIGFGLSRVAESLVELVSERVSNRARAIQTGIYRVRVNRRGVVRASIDDSAEASRGADELQNLVRDRRDFFDLIRIYNDSIRVLRRAYRDASRRDDGSREARAIRQRAQAQLNRALRERTRIQQDIADNTQSVVERQFELENSLFQNILDGFDYVLSFIDRTRRRLELTTGVGDRGDGLIEREIRIERARQRALAREIRRARRRGDMDSARRYEQELEESRLRAEELITQRFTARRDLINDIAERREAAIGRQFRSAEILGTAGDGRGRFDALIVSAQQQIADLARVMAEARRNNRGALADEIQAQIDELNLSIAQLVADRIQSTVDYINQRGNLREQAIGHRYNLASIFRQYGAEANRIGEIMASKMFDAAQLQAAHDEALAMSNFGLAETISAQIWDLYNAIDNLGLERFNALVDDINRAAQVRLSTNDFQQRLAGLGVNAWQAATGFFSPVGLGRTDFGAMGAALQDRGNILRQQRASLAQMLAVADPRATGVIEDLTNQINNLDAEIVENSKAVRDNTNAARQFIISQMRESSDFRLGINSAASSINSALESMSGVADIATQGAILLERQRELLSRGGRERGGLADLFNSIIPGGIDLAYLLSLRGNALAPYLMRLSEGFDRNLFDDDQISMLRDFVNAILSNEQAIIENTKALRDLDGAVTQTFSSTAWRTFRQAIFTGSGRLMPYYQVPQVHTGGWIRRTGIFELEMGERVLERGAEATGVNIDNVNLNVTNPTQALDVPFIGQKLAWGIKTAGRV